MINPIDKLKSMSDRIVYHGSFREISSPLVLNHKFNKDFGIGFYVTDIKSQAEKWSIRKDTTGVVTVYDFKLSPEYNYKYFNTINDEWLNFIVDCRKGVLHYYDVVEGPMADDKLFAWLERYMNNEITREELYILAKFRYKTNQIAFNTSSSINGCLSFKYSYKVGRDVIV